MELELLKKVWQKTTNEQKEGYFISKQEIQKLIKKRSTVAVSEIKRGVRNKVFMAGGIGFLMILFSIFLFNEKEPVYTSLDKFHNTELAILYFIFGLILFFISLFNAVSYRKIAAIEKQNENLKSSIRSILHIIEGAVRVKVYSNAFVLPLTILAIVVVSFIRGSGLFSEPLSLIAAIAGSITFGFFSYILTKKQQEKRYGAQMNVLEESLNELDSEEEI